MNRLPLMRRVVVAVSARRSSVGGGADRIRSSISKLMENQHETNLHHDNDTAASELHASLEALRVRLFPNCVLVHNVDRFQKSHADTSPTTTTTRTN
jgi:hypothetical protein